MTTSVLRSFALVALAALALNGCYFGRSPRAKRAAYVGNGVAALTGVALLVGAEPDSDPCHQPNDGFVCAAGRFTRGIGMLTLGTALLAGALAGTLITTAIPTEPDTAASNGSRVVPLKKPVAADPAVVTGPGLRPAQLTLR